MPPAPIAAALVTFLTACSLVVDKDLVYPGGSTDAAGASDAPGGKDGLEGTGNAIVSETCTEKAPCATFLVEVDPETLPGTLCVDFCKDTVKSFAVPLYVGPEFADFNPTWNFSLSDNDIPLYVPESEKTSTESIPSVHVKLDSPPEGCTEIKGATGWVKKYTDFLTRVAKGERCFEVELEVTLSLVGPGAPDPSKMRIPFQLQVTADCESAATCEGGAE